MLAHETTIGIYPDGKLQDVLIVPDGHEFHLFLTGTHGEPSAIAKSLDLGSIIIVNNDWVYEGDKLAVPFQREIADYILTYSAEEDGQTSLM